MLIELRIKPRRMKHAEQEHGKLKKKFMENE